MTLGSNADEIGSQSVAALQLSSLEDASGKVNSDQSACEPKQSSPNNTSSDMNSVGDVTDELSLVIPGSCDSVSDDERYLSGQCTLLELITESRGGREQTPDTPRRGRVLGISDIEVSESAVTAQRGTTTDKSRRLVSVVSDDTVLFIGAKEKLRKQLNYSGHFYRWVTCSL